MQNHGKRAWLCLPALVLYGCDVSITLASQRPAFWAGAFDTVEEGNPLARVLLLLGPWTFVAAALVWAALFSTVMLVGRRSWAVLLSFGLTFSHALGTACWLPRHGLIGIAAAILLIVAAERLLTWSWGKSDIERAKNEQQELVGTHERPVQIL